LAAAAGGAPPAAKVGAVAHIQAHIDHQAQARFASLSQAALATIGSARSCSTNDNNLVKNPRLGHNL